jgi:uncharacterized iron-regulated protein
MRYRLKFPPLIVATLLVLIGTSHAQEKAAPSVASCLAPSAWYSMMHDVPRALDARHVITEMATREVVLLGERHDDASHHHWQLHTLAALHVLRPDMVIGFESFPRRSQPVLDRWVAGELTERQLLEQTEWNKVWNFPAQLYLPLFHFARLNRIPMLALNVERTLTEAVRKTGWDAVPIERKEGVSRPSAAADAYRESLYDVYAQHAHGPDGKAAPVSRNDAAFRHFVEAQLTWDRAMAQALAAPLLRADSARRPYVVGIMGSGHIRYGHGVPHQLRDLGLRNIGTLLPFSATRDCNELQRGIADAVYALPGMPRDDAPRPRLGVRLEEKAGEVRLAGVTPDSLAAQTGLQRGDRIVSIAGATVTRSDTVIEAVRSQPPGTWLPMEVQRGEQTLQLIVKFPRQ